mmetsp:Transcript_24429/g.60042  ORF Transcript_24429/g.60042 Transcript_24429/m.60042 type:complete len:262 (-) Transcript_24429:1380-2165(-)
MSGISLPGRLVYPWSLPFSTRVRKGSGKPPAGCPMKPCRYSTTEVGNDRVSAFSTTDVASRLLATRNCARSPTTLEEGVTLTMSPSTWLAVAYAALILSHSLPSPLLNAWNLRLVYCPPGISWMYTSADPALMPDSKGEYSPRVCSQYVLSVRIFVKSRPVSSSVPATEPSTAPMEGCDVSPAMASVHTSTTSAPASAHASMLATPVLAVSCVCTWMGRSGNLARRALTSMVAARGFSSPAMSLMASTSMPWFTSCSVRST